MHTSSRRAAALFFAAIASSAGAAPLEWRPPASFDPSQPGLGLPQLPDVRHELLYAPFPSRADEPGEGDYESLEHGTYNHHTLAVVAGDKAVVYWTNHSRDENGPGQRILARWGVLSDDGQDIDWGSPHERLVELAPPPVPVRPRLPLDDLRVDRRFVRGTLAVADDLLISRGAVALYHGWTDDLAYRFPGRDPVPDERLRDTADFDGAYRYDMRWDIGPAYGQAWSFRSGALAPASPLYVDAAPPDALHLTPTKSWPLPALAAPFAAAPLLASAPPELAEALAASRRHDPAQPRYEPGAAHLAANGKHALAHRAQFRRPDGTWVILRDNLADEGHYYAAEASAGAAYPPAEPTNLYGYAMPAAGALPDGRAWVLGNSRGRRDFYLTLSRDGVVFDRTWLVLHIDKAWAPGFAKPKRGGPQYPCALQLGDALWLFYSVGKEQVGVTRIPLSALDDER